jgi:hypothetical protein
MEKRATLFVVLPLLVMGAISACSDDSTNPPANIVYKATLTPGAEVLQNGSSAGVVSSASGTWIGTLDPSSNTLTWTMTFQGLTSNAIQSHIHGPAPATTTANVVLNFQTLPGSNLTTGATSGGSTGSLSILAAAAPTALTISGDSIKKLMDAGQAYVNVHSDNYKAGEIRGQITRQP